MLGHLVKGKMTSCCISRDDDITLLLEFWFELRGGSWEGMPFFGVANQNLTNLTQQLWLFEEYC